MSIEIKITDQHIPVSRTFIDFLYHLLFETDKRSVWGDQQNEKLNHDGIDIYNNANAVVDQVIQNPIATQIINRSYDLTLLLMFGKPEQLKEYHDRIKMHFIVGIPRSGGSYLTKHLFKSIGLDYKDVPSVIGHDGFPDSQPFTIDHNSNGYIHLTRQAAEYMAMIEAFFGKTFGSNIPIIPKKATKAVYHGAFFNKIFGPGSILSITVRHPATTCMSTAEKSGGLPGDGRYVIRSNIESWIQRDIEFTSGPMDMSNTDYFDAYLRYWEDYHHRIADDGLLSNPNHTIIPYESKALMTHASSFYDGIDSSAVDNFVVADYDLPKRWIDEGNAAVRRVADNWSRQGLIFPVESVVIAD